MPQTAAAAAVAPVPPPAPAPAPPLVAAAPVGRPAGLALELLSEATFYDDLLEDLRMASSMLMVTYQFDEPVVHAMLLARLNGRRAFELQMVVDRQAYVSGACRYMRPRLRELARAGAHVYLCDGHSHRDIYGATHAHVQGHQHIKAVVVDRRVAYCGSMNFTRSARTNHEIVLKVRGPIVHEILERCLGLLPLAEAIQ